MTWAQAVMVVAAWALIRWRGDLWWPATGLLFAPRWLFLLPMPTLIVAAVCWRRRQLWGQAAILLVILGPLMNFSIPLGRLADSTGPSYRIMSFNIGEDPIDADGLGLVVDQERLDLICFQESRIHQDELAKVLGSRGWSKDRRGMIWSRLPIVAEWDDFTQFDGDVGQYRRYVARVKVRSAEGAEFVVVDAHLPTMQPGFLALGHGDLEEFRAQENWRAQQFHALGVEVNRLADWPVLVAGDLNTPSDSPLMGPLRDRFTFAFEKAGWGYGYTRPTSLPWVRIDHILADSRWTVTQCRVGPDLGSDHLPLIAEVVLRK